MLNIDFQLGQIQSPAFEYEKSKAEVWRKVYRLGILVGYKITQVKTRMQQEGRKEGSYIASTEV